MLIKFYLSIGFFLTIFSSNVFGSEWKLIHKIPYTNSVNIAAFIDEKQGLTFGSGTQKIYYTSDGGSHWMEGDSDDAVFSSLGIYMNSIDILSSNEIYCAADRGYIFLSKDIGKTWKSLPFTVNQTQPIVQMISFSDAGNALAHLSENLLVKTTNGSQSWFCVKSPSDTIAAIYLRNSSAGYVLSTDGKLYATGDGGNSWETVNIDLKGMSPFPIDMGYSMGAVCFPDENHGMVVLYTIETNKGWLILSTSDGGKNWVREKVSGTQPRGVVFLNREMNLMTVKADSEKMIYVYQRY